MAQTRSKFDTFFSRSMEYLPIAKAFLEQYVPPHLLQDAYLDTLVRVDRVNTSAQLKQRRKDIAYQVQMKGGNSLLVCIEHQSKDDISIPLRFLSYNSKALSAYFERREKIPIVVNCLFYHGKKAPYPHHDTLQAYYTHPEWGGRELNLRIHVADSTQMSDQELLTHSHCAPAELLLKHGRDGNFELEPAAYREVFHSCIAAVGDVYIPVMLAYAVELSDPVVGKKVYHFIEEVLTDKNDLIMTYGQQLRNEGMRFWVQKGMQKGVLQEKLDIARSMLQDRESIDKIQRWTGLSKAAIRKMESGAEGK